nr:MAG TPA: hypothetical protein [Caudoviricetes sp.]
MSNCKVKKCPKWVFIICAYCPFRVFLNIL